MAKNQHGKNYTNGLNINLSGKVSKSQSFSFETL
jgi:hypothetical protein